MNGVPTGALSELWRTECQQGPSLVQNHDEPSANGGPLSIVTNGVPTGALSGAKPWRTECQRGPSLVQNHDEPGGKGGPLLLPVENNFRGGGSPLTLSWTQHFTFIEVTNIILPCMYTYIWIHFRIRTAVRCLNGGKLRRLLKLKTGVCCPPTPPCVGQSGFKQSFKRINSSPPKLVRQAKF